MKKFIVFYLLIILISSFCFAIQFLDLGGLKEKLDAIRKANLELIEARYYKVLEGQTVQCELCPNYCVLTNGKKGKCGVRMNVDGKLFTLVYARPVAVHVDPIEKKPLSHFLPGTTAFSIATAGCNLGCVFCQNWQISQARPEDAENIYLPPKEAVKLAKEYGAKSIAYTYTEPTVFYEYMLEVAKLSKKEGVRNVMHTCGYINQKPLKELLQYMDAANVDLKGFSEEFYVKNCYGHLDPVLESIKTIKKEGVWLEITNLVIPGENDDPKMVKDMCTWLKENTGPDTPLYFAAFHPNYKMKNVPPTPVETLEKLAKVAKEAGLHYVYVGNIYGHVDESTYCPTCGKALIRRMGYAILENNVKDGKCPRCGTKIAGVWQ